MVKTLTPPELTQLREWIACAGHPLQGHWLRLLDELQAARRLLNRIQWAADRYHDNYYACPVCDGLKPDENKYADEPRGHQPGCKLAALIGQPTTNP